MDKILTVYTKDFGKIEVMVKAMRKINSKLRGGIRLLGLSDIEFIQGKTHKTLTDTVLIDDFPQTKKRFERLKTAYRIAEACDRLLKSEEKDEKVWKLITRAYKNLNEGPWMAENGFLFYYYFLWNILAGLGYRPELYVCVVCHKKIPLERAYFNSSFGGITCASCFKKGRTRPGISGKKQKSIMIGSETIKILRLVLEKNWEDVFTLKLDPYTKEAFKEISSDFLSVIPFLEPWNKNYH